MKELKLIGIGESDVLKIIDCQKPTLSGKDKILVRVLYSSLNAVDWKYRKGEFRLFAKLCGTKLGFDVVGIIEEKSENMSEYNIGDMVVGLLPTLVGGARAEYVILAKGEFVKNDANINPIQLAGIPMAGTTAWKALSKIAQVKKGDKVLINGGSSGVGHIAIQLAKLYGAEVTSVSSAKNEEFCRRIGADYTINYETYDFSYSDKKYGIIFDVISNFSMKNIKANLAKDGIYIATVISHSLIIKMLMSRKIKFVYVHPNTVALNELLSRAKEGKLSVNNDKIYPFSQIIKAHEYAEKSRTIGKIIIEITSNEFIMQ